MSKHTPGPWIAKPVGFGILRRGQIEDRDGNIVAELSNLNEDSALIEAAPDMLEALDVIRIVATKPHHPNALKAIREISENEIAKAKGGIDE